MLTFAFFHCFNTSVLNSIVCSGFVIVQKCSFQLAAFFDQSQTANSADVHDSMN